jgi:hypothetical protein
VFPDPPSSFQKKKKKKKKKIIFYCDYDRLTLSCIEMCFDSEKGLTKIESYIRYEA